MPLDLLVPHLLLAPDAPADLRSLRLPSLEKWLARADSRSHPAKSAAAWLAAEHGLQEHAPFAVVSLAADAPGAEGAWLRADPVHLRIEGDTLRLHAASVAELSIEEARALAAALQDHFRGDGFEFRVAAADRWYVRVPAADLPLTTPLDEALGRNVFGLLPEGRGAFNWRSALTEAQMVLSSHAVTEARAAAGKAAINSVWFWGEGAAPGSLARRYASVHADDAFARGLGTLSGAKVLPGAHGAAGLGSAHGEDCALAMLSTLAAPANTGDEAAWKSAAEALDRTWFAAMGDLLARFDAVRIVLPGPAATRIATVTPASRWRWFRRPRPLTAHA